MVVILGRRVGERLGLVEVDVEGPTLRALGFLCHREEVCSCAERAFPALHPRNLHDGIVVIGTRIKALDPAMFKLTLIDHMSIIPRARDSLSFKHTDCVE